MTMTMGSLIALLVGALAVSAAVFRLVYVRALGCTRRLWREHRIIEPRTHIGRRVWRLLGEYYR